MIAIFPSVIRVIDCSAVDMAARNSDRILLWMEEREGGRFALEEVWEANGRWMQTWSLHRRRIEAIHNAIVDLGGGCHQAEARCCHHRMNLDRLAARLSGLSIPNVELMDFNLWST